MAKVRRKCYPDWPTRVDGQDRREEPNMDDTTSAALAGRCGLYCGACCIYRTQRDHAELAARYAARFNCPPEKIRCNGCGDLKEDSWGIDCELVRCLEGKGYDYCHECAEFEANTCERYRNLADAYLEEDGVDMRKNLRTIRDGRIREWLEESAKRYTCPHCCKPTIAGRESCHHCSGSLG